MAKRVSKVRRAPLKVGQRVVVRIGSHKIAGVLVEDRGAIGQGGRRLWRVRRLNSVDTEVPPAEFEVPAEQVAPAASSRPAQRARSAVKPPARQLAR